MRIEDSLFIPLILGYIITPITPLPYGPPPVQQEQSQKDLQIAYKERPIKIEPSWQIGKGIIQEKKEKYDIKNEKETSSTENYNNFKAIKFPTMEPNPTHIKKDLGKTIKNENTGYGSHGTNKESNYENTNTQNEPLDTPVYSGSFDTGGVTESKKYDYGNDKVDTEVEHGSVFDGFGSGYGIPNSENNPDDNGHNNGLGIFNSGNYNPHNVDSTYDDGTRVPEQENKTPENKDDKGYDTSFAVPDLGDNIPDISGNRYDTGFNAPDMGDNNPDNVDSAYDVNIGAPGLGNNNPDNVDNGYDTGFGISDLGNNDFNTAGNSYDADSGVPDLGNKPDSVDNGYDIGTPGLGNNNVDDPGNGYDTGFRVPDFGDNKADDAVNEYDIDFAIPDLENKPEVIDDGYDADFGVPNLGIHPDAMDSKYDVNIEAPDLGNSDPNNVDEGYDKGFIVPDFGDNKPSTIDNGYDVELGASDFGKIPDSGYDDKFGVPDLVNNPDDIDNEYDVNNVVPGLGKNNLDNLGNEYDSGFDVHDLDTNMPDNSDNGYDSDFGTPDSGDSRYDSSIGTPHLENTNPDNVNNGYDGFGVPNIGINPDKEETQHNTNFGDFASNDQKTDSYDNGYDIPYKNRDFEQEEKSSGGFFSSLFNKVLEKAHKAKDYVYKTYRTAKSAAREAKHDIKESFQNLYYDLHQQFSIALKKFREYISSFGLYVQTGSNYAVQRFSDVLSEARCSEILLNLEAKMKSGDERIAQLFQMIGQKVTKILKSKNSESQSIDEGLLQPDLYQERDLSQDFSDPKFPDIFQDPEVHKELNHLVEQNIIKQEEMEIIIQQKKY